MLFLNFLVLRPSIYVLCKIIIKTWEFTVVPMISFMDDHDLFLHLANDTECLYAWVREGQVIADCAFRLLNWTIEFDV